MRSRLMEDNGYEKTFVLVLDDGEEAIGTLEAFALHRGMAGSHFTAVGAFADARLAYFDWVTRTYHPIPVQEPTEIITLTGDIVDQDGRPVVHAHAVLGNRRGQTFGGHLLEARVRPTLEIVLAESPTHLRRTPDPATGLPMINLQPYAPHA